MRGSQPIGLPDDFWTEPTLIASLATRDIGTLFQAVNVRHGVSQMRIGAAVGMEQNQVCRIIKGAMVVRHLDVFERIADGLAMPRRARLLMGLAPGTERDRGGVPGLVRTSPYDRAAHLTASSSTPEEILRMTVRRSRQFTIRVDQDLGPEAVDQLHEDTRYLATSYPQQPLAELLPDIAATQDAIFSALEARHRPASASTLYLLAGAVGGMLAKASHDMGDPRGALTHARTAFLCAEHADHDGLRAWTKGLQSFIAYWAGRPHEALKSAEDGMAHARRSGGTASVWLSVNEARAWASLGDVEKTREAIHRADDQSGQVDPDDLDELGGICTFGRSRQLYYAADALAQLPSEANEAEHTSLLAVEAYGDESAPDWSFSDQAGSSADLAIARVAGGEVEGAADALRPVLELPAAQRINGIVASLRRVHDALGAAPVSSATTDLQQEIECFSRTPLAGIVR